MTFRGQFARRIEFGCFACGVAVDKLDFDFGAIGACKLSLAVSFAVFLHYFGSAAVRHFLLVQTIARATTFIITC